MAKLDAAQARARAHQTPYWSAYSFDVRPGVARVPKEHSGGLHGTVEIAPAGAEVTA